jgi:outer membrane protein TolC
MKLLLQGRRLSIPRLALVTTMLLGGSRLFAEPLSLQRAIELALARSTSSVAAKADVERAFASFRELHNNYYPQLVAGSGLGYSFGFPLTLEGAAPSVFNVSAQSTIYNPSQLQFTNAARKEWIASQFQDKGQRAAVIQDVAISYAELGKWEARLGRLLAEVAQDLDMERIVAQRSQEGLDSTIDLNKAKLTTARTRLHIAEARGSADALRHHLSHLTGVPPSSFEIAPDTIPALPPVLTDDDLSAQAVASSPAIKSADQHALGESMRALGEHRALWPSIDFSAQYARLAAYNNYDQYYKKYQPNNAIIGVSIRFPFFSASQKARAQAADADAQKAKQEARAARDKVSEDTLRLQRAVEQLAAAREVARLESEIAASLQQAAQTRVDAGTGTVHELADARVDANERFLIFQDADFEYQRARMSLLLATGELEKWALQTSSGN